MKGLCLILLMLISTQILAQTYQESILKHREHYKSEFLTNGGPLKKNDLEYLRFYEPDANYQVKAMFKKSEDVATLFFATSDGQKQEYFKHGVFTFEVKGKKVTLNVYRSLALMRMPQYKNYLFVPFKDMTNGKETYGGGRYLDLETTDIQKDSVILDFNKAYNPYCAFSNGYSCPIPPKENHLTVSIDAGEKTFGKEH
jgi:uncharacterized protein